MKFQFSSFPTDRGRLPSLRLIGQIEPSPRNPAVMVGLLSLSVSLSITPAMKLYLDLYLC